MWTVPFGRISCFPHLRGLNLAESFYLAMPSLSWQTVVIVDPLCAPFRTAAFGDSQAEEPPVDADTELPAHFSARRLATLQGLAAIPALKLVLRAEARNARGNSEGALDALKKASSADSASTFVWHALAMAHERRGDHAESAATIARSWHSTRRISWHSIIWPTT